MKIGRKNTKQQTIFTEKSAGKSTKEYFVADAFSEEIGSRALKISRF